MSFTDAVRSAFSKYVTFSGRARRSEYWYFTLFALLLYVVSLMLGAVTRSPVIPIIIILALVLPALAVTIRRLHDAGRSGGWYFISFIPLGGIVLLVFLCQDSERGTNRFGPSVKYPGVDPIQDQAAYGAR